MSNEDLLKIKELLSSYKAHLVTIKEDFKIDIKRTAFNAKWYDNQKTKQQKHLDTLSQIDELIKKINNGNPT